MTQFPQNEKDDANRRIADLLDEVRTAASIVHAQHKSGVVIGYAKALCDLGMLTDDECKDVCRKALLTEQGWMPPNLHP